MTVQIADEYGNGIRGVSLRGKAANEGDSPLRASSAAGDGGSAPSDGILQVLPFQYVYNGASWDRWRNNQQGALLVSAARTSAAASAEQTNYNALGVVLFLDVTVASGTGGLQVKIQVKDPVSGNWLSFNTSPAAVTATGTTTYALYPGATAGNTQNTSGVLPRSWRAYVIHGDGSSYTYSLAYAYIL